MSNLKLPTMTYGNLINRLGALAYATTAQKYDDYVAVSHHGTVIAILRPDKVTVTTGGYSSSTTRNRINTILSDNGIHNYNITQRQFEQTLQFAAPGEKSVYSAWPGVVNFERTSTGWMRLPE